MTTRSTGLLQQRGGVVDQVGVQRVVAGDQHDQRALAPPARPAGLLPERGDRSGEPGEHHRVQAGDVDTQLQRVGGGQAAQSPLGQGALQRGAVLGEVTGPIRRHRLGQRWCDVVQPRPCGQRSEFRTTPRPDERQGLRSLGDQVGHHACRLRTGGAAHGRAVLPGQIGPQRGLPQRHRPRPLR